MTQVRTLDGTFIRILKEKRLELLMFTKRLDNLYLLWGRTRDYIAIGRLLESRVVLAHCPWFSSYARYSME